MSATLQVSNLTKYYVSAGAAFKAVDNVSFSLEPGSCLGIVGESGSGKSTIAKMITRFERPDAGRIELDGADIWDRRAISRKAVYRFIQMVFQNPADSFNPNRTIGSTLKETAINFGTPRNEADDAVRNALCQVSLKEECAKRFRHQISGGECQRAAIARALLASPSVLICDEVTSALDVSVQAQIVDLLHRLRDERGISLLFISHDLAVVQLLCESVIVMNEGKVVEAGATDDVLSRPKENYTRTFIASAYQVPPSDLRESEGGGACSHISSGK